MNAYEQIQNRISTVAKDAVDTFNGKIVNSNSETLIRLGFTGSPSIIKDAKKVNSKESLRARLIQYFGNHKIVYGKELEALEKKYKLSTHVASRFINDIPIKNQNDIVSFAETLKRNKWNHGSVETDLYHIPITTDFLVTAPPEMFRKAINTSEMNKEELKRWMEEDPIVWKKIFRFDPFASFNNRNIETDMYIMVTAWGIEETLINNN